jgi:eukaryotic-like serine/threonine-protein kinase
MAQQWDVPGYTEVKALGSGGFGDVVLAWHDASGTLVAIKYLRRELLADPEFAAMFRGEAEVLASVEDPNVVRLYEYVQAPAGAAIVMELIDGVCLREILARHGKTSAEAALVVLQGSLLGLAAAHRRGVVHRDYKPENVLVDGAGASKLTDFGIAARAGDRAMAAGTLAYAPPEQFGGGPASPSGDVYAATATFYECLTGHPPFSGDSAERLVELEHFVGGQSVEKVADPGIWELMRFGHVRWPLVWSTSPMAGVVCHCNGTGTHVKPVRAFQDVRPAAVGSGRHGSGAWLRPGVPDDRAHKIT